MYRDTEYTNYLSALAKNYIQKFYEAGYITSREYNALLEALNKTEFDFGYISIVIYVDDRKLKFVCVDDTCVSITYNASDNYERVSAYIDVFTKTFEHDFSVRYIRENNEFSVCEVV